MGGVVINSQEDWWKVLDGAVDGIGECFSRVNMSDQFHELVEAQEARDYETILRLLNRCWAAAPDTPAIRSWPKWFDLCDLCSEAWVFYVEMT